MTIIALAGATGNMGSRLARELRRTGTEVRALVRASGDPAAVKVLEDLGCRIIFIDLADAKALKQSLEGADCVASTLSGVGDVIVDAQTRLLDAAVAAGVPRFMPSDFSVDFRGHRPGTNRNLDLRRAFMERLDRAPIRATSVLCGMFSDLLRRQAPMVLHPIRRVVYWGSARQQLDFTSIEDTAVFTAAAVLDDTAPRWLCIAGETTTAEGIARSASSARKTRYRVLRAGPLIRLSGLIWIARKFQPGENQTFPAWQGMQYFHSMFEGGVAFGALDNDRYGQRRWTSVEDILKDHDPHVPV